MMNWSELPYDVLEHLTSFLSLADYHRFGAVCQNWGCVVNQKHNRPSYQLPWLVLGDDGATGKRTFFNLSENKHYCIDIPGLQGQYLCGSSYGWLFTMDIELNCRLLHPFTGKQHKLPPLPPYNHQLNINSYLTKPTEDCSATFEVMQIELVWKAILDHDPSEGSDFKVVIVFGEYRKLAFWKSGELTWSLTKGRCDMMDDVLFYNGRLYAVSALPDSILYVLDDWSNPKLTEGNVCVPTYLDTASYAYLVNFKGELLLVQRYQDYNEEDEEHYSTMDVRVYKIDLQGKVFSECKHIEGSAIFLGTSSAVVVVDPSKFPSCRKNAIYFTDISLLGNAPKYGRDDLVMYDMDGCTFARYYPTNVYISEIAAPIWFPIPW